MVGSYGPKEEAHEFLAAEEEAPSGMPFRGDYDIHCIFTDGKRSFIYTVGWVLEVAKDW